MHIYFFFGGVKLLLFFYIKKSSRIEPWGTPHFIFHFFHSIPTLVKYFKIIRIQLYNFNPNNNLLFALIGVLSYMISLLINNFDRNCLNNRKYIFLKIKLLNFFCKKYQISELPLSVSFSICERVTPRLSHANSAVVLSAVKVLMKFLELLPKDSEYYNTLLKKLSPPLVTLLSGEPEVQYVALRNINLIVQKRLDCSTYIFQSFLLFSVAVV